MKLSLASCLPIFILIATLLLPICSAHVWNGGPSSALFKVRGGETENASPKTSDKYIISIRLPGGSMKTLAISSNQKLSSLYGQLTKIANSHPSLKVQSAATLVSIEPGKSQESNDQSRYIDITLSSWINNEADVASLGITKSCKIVLHVDKYQPLPQATAPIDTNSSSEKQTKKAKSKKVSTTSSDDDAERIRIERQKASKQQVVLSRPLEAMFMQVHTTGRMLALIGRQRLQHTTASRAAERKKKQRSKQRKSTWTLADAASKTDEDQPKQLLEILGAVDLQLPQLQLSQEADLNLITDKLKKLQDGICNELGLQVVGLASRSVTPWNPTVFRYTAASALALGRNASSFIHLSVVSAASEADEHDDDSPAKKKKKSKKRVLALGGESSNKFQVEPFHLSNQALELCASGQLPLLPNTKPSSKLSLKDNEEDGDKKDMLPLAKGRSVFVGGRVVEQINCYLLAVTLPIISHQTSKPSDLMSIFPSPAAASQDPAARRFVVKLARNLLKIGKDKDRGDTLSRMRDLQLLEYLKSMLSTAAFQSLTSLLRYESNNDISVDEEKEVEAMQQRQLEWQPSPQLAMELDALRLSLEAEDEDEVGSSSDDDEL